MDAPTPLAADADPALALQQRLAPGEPLLWQGAPRQGLLWRSEDWLGVVFSAAWLAIGAWIADGDRLVLVPFGLVALYVLVVRFFVQARVRAGQAYGLTSARILIFSRRKKGGGIRSIPLDAIGEILLRDHGDGSGTLRFGDIRPGAGATSELRDTKPLAPAYFDSIPDATVVCERIRSLRGETGSAS